jgi:hypothetical protein
VQSVTAASFLRVLQIPLPVLIPPTAPHPSVGPLVAAVPSEVSLTPPHE